MRRLLLVLFLVLISRAAQASCMDDLQVEATRLQGLIQMTTADGTLTALQQDHARKAALYSALQILTGGTEGDCKTIIVQVKAQR